MTGNYDIDFLIKLFVYFIFLLAWQIPFIYMMWPRIRYNEGKKSNKLVHRDPRDSTKVICIDTDQDQSTEYSAVSPMSQDQQQAAEDKGGKSEQFSESDPEFINLAMGKEPALQSPM